MTKITHSMLLLSAVFAAVGWMPAGARQNNQQKDVTFNVQVPLTFKGRVASGPLRKSEIPALLDLPVSTGGSDPEEEYGLEMTPRDDGKEFEVYTCREWKKATDEGAYARTTADMITESFFIRACRALFALQTARAPVKSFLPNPHVTLTDAGLLPAEMLAYMPDDNSDKDPLAGKTISEVVARKDVQNAKGVLTVSYGGFKQQFEEIARADFNADGVEDILVFEGYRAEGGTMAFWDYTLLTRTKPSGPLNEIRTEKRSSKAD